MNLNAPPLHVIWWGSSVWPTVLFCWAAGYLGTSSVQDQEDEADEGRAGEDACLEPTGPSFASDGLHDHFEVSTDALLSSGLTEIVFPSGPCSELPIRMRVMCSTRGEERHEEDAPDECG